MRLTHHMHDWAPGALDAGWSERVDREAALHTARAKALFEARERRLVVARRRLKQAEDRAQRAGTGGRHKKKQIRDLWLLVEQRRDELQAIQREMTQSPQGSQHRGTRSYRTL